MGVAPTLRAVGHIVKVVDTLDFEGNGLTALEEGEVAASVSDSGDADAI
jgi:hypothetical protein